tara:strand:- start:118152 stop:118610 length:459 start_codon:yes stop_codon:yes gene_type:complete
MTNTYKYDEKEAINPVILSFGMRDLRGKEREALRELKGVDFRTQCVFSITIECDTKHIKTKLLMSEESPEWTYQHARELCAYDQTEKFHVPYIDIANVEDLWWKEPKEWEHATLVDGELIKTESDKVYLFAVNLPDRLCRVDFMLSTEVQDG